MGGRRRSVTHEVTFWESRTLTGKSLTGGRKKDEVTNYHDPTRSHTGGDSLGSQTDEL